MQNEPSVSREQLIAICVGISIGIFFGRAGHSFTDILLFSAIPAAVSALAVWMTLRVFWKRS